MLYFLGIKEQEGAFWGFFAMFMVLFFATGIGNASTFQMIPIIMRKEVARLMPGLSANDQLRNAEKESAAIIGFTSAIAAYGAFLHPEKLRHVDHGDRSARCGIVGLRHLLRRLCSGHMVFLYAPRKLAA